MLDKQDVPVKKHYSMYGSDEFEKWLAKMERVTVKDDDVDLFEM